MAPYGQIWSFLIFGPGNPDLVGVMQMANIIQLTHTLTQTHAHTHTLSFSYTHTHAHAHTLLHTHTLSRTHTHAHAPTLSEQIMNCDTRRKNFVRTNLKFDAIFLVNFFLSRIEREKTLTNVGNCKRYESILKS